MKQNKHSEMVKQILINIGGKQNIKKSFHCITRLRFNFNDNTIVNVEEIKKIKGILGVNVAGDQYQLIIGNEVTAVYQELEQQLKLTNEVGNFGTVSQSLQKKKFKFSFNGLIDVISSLFTPIIGILAGAGLFQGILSLVIVYSSIDKQTADILGLIGNAAINMLPVLLAYTAAKKFNVNPALAIAVVGVLISPTMITASTNKIENLYLWGMPIPILNYAGAVFPPLLAVYALKWIMIGLTRVLPKSLQIIFSALIVLVIMVPLMLIVFGPIGNYIGLGLAWVFEKILNWQTWFAVMLYALLRPLQITFGLHYPFFPIIIANITNNGHDFLSTGSLVSTVAQAGAILGIFFCCKKSENKEISGAAAVSAAIGITEPALYGGILKYKTALFATMFTGAVGGAVAGFFNVSTHVFGMSIPFAPINYFDANNISGFIALCITLVAVYLLTAGIVILLGINEMAEDKTKYYLEIKWWNFKAKFMVWKKLYKVDYLKNKDFKTRLHQKISFSPVGKGNLFKLTELGIDDQHQGYGMQMRSNQLVSPVDGTILKIEENQILIQTQKVKLLLHLGTPEFNLNENAYKILQTQGQQIKRKQPLVEFDKEMIKKNKIKKYAYVQILEIEENQEILIKKDYGATNFFRENLIIIPQTKLEGDLYAKIS